MTDAVSVEPGEPSQPILRGPPGMAAGNPPDVAFAKSRLIRRGLSPRVLQRVREYVEAHLEDNVTMHALANIAGLSISYFSRAFRESEGLTPHRYLMQCRLLRALELLVRTELPLCEIARASGFSDQSHCTRRFQEHFGVTPGRYRQLMREDVNRPR